MRPEETQATDGFARPGLVSVVIPTYNCARYLPEAIDSVLAQTYRDFEIIVVDDGSTDNTAEVLARYGDTICVIRQTNQGRSAARNAGILAARGEYIAFLDADDVWLPHKLERQVAVMESQPGAAWCYSDYREFGPLGRVAESFFERTGRRPPPQGWILLEEMAAPLAWTCTVIARANCFSKAGMFDTSFPVSEDREMWLRLAAYFDAVCVDEVLALYRRHETQVTSRTARSGVFAYHDWRAVSKLLRNDLPRLPADRRRAVAAAARESLAGSAFRVGLAAVRAGEVQKAFYWLVRAVLADRRMPAWRLALLGEALLPRAAMDACRRLHDRVRAQLRRSGRGVSHPGASTSG